jgi:alkaline phosphatase D
VSLTRLQFPDGELGAWFVLGDVTDRSVRVWARDPNGPVEARLIVGNDQRSASIETDPARDHVGAVVLDMGASRSGASFELSVGDEVRQGRFAPSPGLPAAFTFAFGSCHEPFSGHQADGRVERHAGAAIYPAITRLLAERQASFALWLGDQVYSDAVSEASVRQKAAEVPSITDEELLDAYRHLYRGFFNERGFRALAELIPAYLMWDDHDIFDGWGSLIDRTEFDERVYRAAERAFVEYQHLRNPSGELSSGPPFGYSFWHADVGFHVLDLRGERDFNAGRVMGADGWGRLDEFLQSATERGVKTVFLGASVPVVHASPALMTALERLRTSSGRDVRDRWSVPTFAAERTRLVDRLFAWQSAEPRRQIIVLSGDVHVGAAFNVRSRTGKGQFHQWTSSALSTPDGIKHVLVNRLLTKFVRLGERELRVWRRGLATSNNVGLVEVDPDSGGGHVVRLTVHQYDEKTDKVTVGLHDVASAAGW